MNFFPGEELENEIEEMGMIIHTDEEINEKYIKGEVRIVTEQGRFQLTTIENIVEGEDYILNPEYQRRHRWNNERKSKLIESFIMNVPVPPIFLYEKDYSVYEVMDGLQRLTAIYDFYTDRFSLVGLEEWGELNGLVYSQLPIQVKKGIDRRYLSSIILLKETAKTDKEAQRLKQMVFERINSGGEKLEPQETRNALYNGELNQLCIKIARDKYFCRMWGIPEQINEEEEQELDKELIENPLYKKMSDVELILRFFAFRHLDKWEKMTLERFLDYFLKKGNLFDANVIIQYEKLFKETIQFVYEVLGENAFCLYRVRNEDWKWYDRPTKVVFDPIMHVFSQNLENKDILISKKEEIQRDLKTFYMDNYKDFGGRNTGKTHVILRIEKMNTFIKKYLEAAE